MATFEWLSQDTELLALLLNWDDDGRSDVDAEPTARGAPKGKKNGTRERIKREKKELVASINELTMELRRLRERRELQMRRQSTSDLAAVWEGITRRHRLARKRAKTLNAKLRGMVETHQAIARELLRAVQRAEQVRQATLSSSIFGGQDTGDDAHLLPHLTTRLQRASEQWHLPFRRSETFQRCRGDFVDINVVRDGQLDSVVETTARTSYPFPARQVEDAMWRYLENTRLSDDEFSFSMEKDESSLVCGIRARSELTTVGLHGTQQARFLRRRFRNDDGDLLLVLATRGSVELGSATPHDTRTQLTEDLWLRIKQRSTLPPLTTIETVRRSHVAFVGKKRPSRVHMDQTKRLFTLIVENQMDVGQGEIERLVMEPQGAPLLKAWMRRSEDGELEVVWLPA